MKTKSNHLDIRDFVNGWTQHENGAKGSLKNEIAYLRNQTFKKPTHADIAIENFKSMYGIVMKLTNTSIL